MTPFPASHRTNIDVCLWRRKTDNAVTGDSGMLMLVFEVLFRAPTKPHIAECED
jgi:hypothetical protein